MTRSFHLARRTRSVLDCGSPLPLFVRNRGEHLLISPCPKIVGDEVTSLASISKSQENQRPVTGVLPKWLTGRARAPCAPGLVQNRSNFGSFPHIQRRAEDRAPYHHAHGRLGQHALTSSPTMMTFLAVLGTGALQNLAEFLMVSQIATLAPRQAEGVRP